MGHSLPLTKFPLLSDKTEIRSDTLVIYKLKWFNWAECNLIWNHTRDFKIEQLIGWLILQEKLWSRIGCCVLLIKSFLVGWKKEAIWGKKWCNTCIIHTTESQLDCKDHQWFRHECNKGKSQHFSPLSSYNLHNKDVLDYKKIIKVYWMIENILFMKTYHTCIAHLVNVRQITMLSK